MSGHREGPWTIQEYGDNDSPALVIHKDNQTRVCFMATAGSNGDPAKIRADAHVIVTAPKMLAGLKAIRDGTVTGKVGGNDVVWFDDITTLYDFCEELIAEAEGL